MLTINITKAELKKAFFGKEAVFTRELSADSEPNTDLDTVLLKIMLENRQPKEVA